MCPLISSGRTGSRRLTLGMRFDRFLLDLLALLALLDRFVAIVTYSFDFFYLALESSLSFCGCTQG
jgi:hypothetical protein